MDTPLLGTKLFVPSLRPGLVARPRLVERLNSALTTPLTLVSAPAGFGKTTVLTQWANSLTPIAPLAWIQLDESDNDPVRFWEYFIAAVRILKPTVGEGASAALHAPQAYTGQAMLTLLINDITTMLDDFVLVLDDYHLVKAEAVHDAVNYLVDHCPTSMHIVMASRTDPNISLAHMRGRGTLTEIRADDLRFTMPEAEDFFLESHNIKLKPDQLIALNDKAEGWVVGLRMAALALQKPVDKEKFVDSFTGSQRYVMDYLLEEVLNQQTSDVRQFLLRTSVLDRMTASLCEAVTGFSDSTGMLSRLEKANMFLVPLDDSRMWYRYHHLFADLLLHQLEMNCVEDEVAQLHERASRWFFDHGHLHDAVRHTLAARDWGGSMKLIRQLTAGLIARAEYITLTGWLSRIPEDVLRTDPSLYLHYANALATAGRLEASEAALAYLTQAAGDQKAVLGQAATLQAEVARRRGNPELGLASAIRALSLLPGDELGYRARASLIEGFVLFDKGRLPEAAVVLADAHRIGRQAGNHYVAAGALAYSAQTLWLRGRLNQSMQIGQEAAELAGQSPAAAIPR